MKSHILHLIVFLFILSCSQGDNYPTTEADNVLTLEEAQSLFYNQVAMTRTSGTGEQSQDRGIFYLEELEPYWHLAESTEDDILYNIDIPASSSNAFRAWYNNYHTGAWTWTNIYYELVAVKDKELGLSGIYVLFYIPDEYYAAEHDENFARKFHNTDDLGDYDGLKVYTDLKGYPQAISEYRNGQLRRHVFAGDKNLSQPQLSQKIGQIFGGITIQRGNHSGLNSRSSEDTLWDFSKFDKWDTTYWYWIDSSGTFYLAEDTNGDGKPDAIAGDVVVVNGRRHGGGGTPILGEGEDPSLSPDPDRRPGGGGSVGIGGSGHVTGNEERQPILQDPITINCIYRNPEDSVFFYQYFLHRITEIRSDCMIGTLLSNIEGNFSLTIIFDSHFHSGSALAMNHHGGDSITFNCYDYEVIIEELVHSYQKFLGRYSRNYNGINAEIEAKYITYQYMRQNNKTETTIPFFWQSFATVVNGGDLYGIYTDIGYQTLIDLVSSLGYTPDNGFGNQPQNETRQFITYKELSRHCPNYK